MDTWVWLVIVAVVAVVLFAVAWRSSGRAKPRGRGPENSLTPEQVERINLLALRNRAGQMGPFA
jgi:hypothetical protein